MKILKVAAYYRYSTDNQKQIENSEARQKDSVERVIQARPDWKLVQSFTDHSVSGLDDKPELMKLRRMVEDGELDIDIICIDELSRITRRGISKSGLDVDWIDQAGILLSLAKKDMGNPFPISKLDDDLSLIVDNWQNNQYVKKLSANVAGGMRTKFVDKEMGWVGKAPFGYDLKRQLDMPSTLVPNKDLPIIKQMFERVLAGGSINSCIELLEKTSRYKNSPNKHGNNASIKNILRGAIYAGIRTFGVRGVGKFNTVRGDRKSWVEQNPLKQAAYYKEYVADGYKPAITIQQYKDVQEILDRNQGQFKKFPARQKYRYSGLLRCGHCGTALNAIVTGGKKSDSKKIIKYVCPKSADVTKVCKEGDRPYNKGIRTDELEKMIELQFGILLMSADFHYSNLKNLVDKIIDQNKSAIQSVDDDAELQKARLEELMDLFRKTSSPSLKDAIEKQSAKIDQIRTKQDESVQVDNLVEFAREQYESMNSGVGYFRYFGHLYQYAADLASYEDDKVREGYIRDCANSVMEETRFHMALARSGSEIPDGVSPESSDEAITELMGLYGESLPPEDQLEMLKNMGLDHMKVSFELGLWRGQPRRIPTELGLVFKMVTPTKHTDNLVLVNRYQISLIQ